jgi:HlyD family secretion protein
VDGTVAKLISEKGERVVGTGMMAGTEIMTIADLNEMEARVEVGEVDVVLVQLGQRARLEVDSFRDRKFAGVVTQIANSAKTTGANSQQEATKFEVRIRITDKDRFLPGMSTTAEIETRYRTNVLTVPIQSVTTRLPKGAKKDEKKSAMVSAEDKDLDQELSDLTKKKDKSGPKPIDVVFTVEGDKAKTIPVKRGISDEAYYEILEGIAEGQEIVTGSYKAIARELEDEKLAKVDNTKKDAKPEEKK